MQWVNPGGESGNIVSSAATGAAGGSMLGPLGSVAGGALGVIGGLAGNLLNKASSDQSARRQEDALKNTIRWRVADAKAAGIHPLYALGAPAFNVSPMAFGDQVGGSLGEMGQSISNVAARMKTEAERKRDDMETQLVAAQLGESDARREMYLSEAAKNRQTIGNGLGGGSGAFTGPFGTGIGPEGQAPANPQGVGVIERKPMEQLSHKRNAPETVAGTHSYGQQYEMYPGFYRRLPQGAGEGPAETEEALGYVGGLYNLMENTRIWGKPWLRDLWRLRMGMKPLYRYSPQEVGEERLHHERSEKLPPDWRDYSKDFGFDIRKQWQDMKEYGRTGFPQRYWKK